MALLVQHDGLLGLLESGLAHEKGPKSSKIPREHVLLRQEKRLPNAQIQDRDCWAGPGALKPLNFAHLGSVMPAACRTRPQYVLRSYCDSGSSRLPGMEADMVLFALLWRQSPRPWAVFAARGSQRQAYNCRSTEGRETRGRPRIEQAGSCKECATSLLPQLLAEKAKRSSGGRRSFDQVN